MGWLVAVVAGAGWRWVEVDRRGQTLRMVKHGGPAPTGVSITIVHLIRASISASAPDPYGSDYAGQWCRGEIATARVRGSVQRSNSGRAAFCTSRSSL